VGDFISREGESVQDGGMCARVRVRASAWVRASVWADAEAERGMQPGRSGFLGGALWPAYLRKRAGLGRSVGGVRGGTYAGTQEFEQTKQAWRVKS
jgi:hypothetical protein